MAEVNRKHISPLTTEDLVREIDARDPGFAARVAARVAELAFARKLREKRGLAAQHVRLQARSAKRKRGEE